MSILFQSDAVLALVVLFAREGDVHFLGVIHDASVARGRADASVLRGGSALSEEPVRHDGSGNRRARALFRGQEPGG